MNNINKKLVAPFAVLAFVCILLAIIGGFRAYSPVPFWDMWDSYINFYAHAMDGDTSIWWAQHNEHRVFLARLLFWFDLHFLDGRGWFLVCINYLLVFISCGVFYQILHEKLNQPEEQTLRWILTCIVWALLFYWAQEENLTWGFQSQFFLAQLLPLCGFFFLHQSHNSVKHGTRYFVCATICGVLAIGSMANGVLALPLMVLLALFLRMKWHRILLLLLLSVACVSAFFYNYTSTGGTSLKQIWSEAPFVRYFLIYIGGIFYHMTGKTSPMVALIAGVFLLLAALYHATVTILSIGKKPTSLNLALLTFLVYFGGTALATTIGRSINGISYAVESRYQTPGVMAWSVILVLFSASLMRVFNKTPLRVWPPLLLLMLAFLPLQITANHSKNETLFQRKVAALALELGIKDDNKMRSIYPDERIYSAAKVAVDRDLSFFNDPLIHNTNGLLGQTDTPKNSNIQCNMRVDSWTIDTFRREGTSEDYVSIHGWIFQPVKQNSPSVIHILDEQRRIIGYGISGGPRPDLGKAVAPQASEAGYVAYIQSDYLGQPIIVRGLNPDCESVLNKWAAVPPTPPYRALNIPASPDNSNKAVASSVLTKNEWNGKDSYSMSTQQDTLPNAQILGSWSLPAGDANAGRMTLHLKRGDVVWFRSDSKTDMQKIIVEGGTRQFIEDAPNAPQWTALEFSRAGLPAEFDVTFVDGGNGWGEWMALGFKK